MNRPQREATLQGRIHVRVSERHPARHIRIAGRFDAFDAAAQSRERVHACAGHCARSFKIWTAIGSEENQKLAQMFMICSNIKLRGTAESIGLTVQAIHE